MGPLVKRFILETDLSSWKLTEIFLMILNYLYKFWVQWYDLKKFLTMFSPRGVKRCITFLKQFQQERNCAHHEGQNIFVWHTQSKLPEFYMVKWCPFPRHPQSASIHLKEVTHNQVFGGGQLKPNWNSLDFLHISTCELHIQLTLSSKFSRRKKLKWSKKEWFSHHSPSRSFPKCTEAFTAIVYTVLACFVIKWLNQSSQILNSLKKNIG